jgi:hypothetical protein
MPNTTQREKTIVQELGDLPQDPDVMGDRSVGVLLENAVAEKLAFIERTKRLIRHLIESRTAAKPSE